MSMVSDEVLLSWKVPSQRMLLASLQARRELLYAFIGLVFIYVFFPVFVTRLNPSYGTFLFGGGALIAVYTYLALMRKNDVHVELTKDGIRLNYASDNAFVARHLQHFKTRSPLIAWDAIESYRYDAKNETVWFTLKADQERLIRHFQDRHFVIVVESDLAELALDILAKYLKDRRA